MRAWAERVSQDHALGQRTAKSKQRRLDLVRIQIDLRIHQRGRQQISRIGAHAARKLPGDVLGLICGQAMQRELKFWTGFDVRE